MTKHNFMIGDIFRSAWSRTKEHAWFLFRTFLALGVILAVSSKVPVLSTIVGLFVGIAIIAVSLVIVRGGNPVLNDFTKSFKTYKTLWHYTVATIFYVLIVILGLIALILPGVYLLVRLSFYKFIIVDDENINPIDALKKSMKMTHNYFWKLFGFMLVVILFNILGALFFIIGLLVTIPVSVLASAILYEKLLSHKNSEENHHHSEPLASTVSQ